MRPLLLSQRCAELRKCLHENKMKNGTLTTRQVAAELKITIARVGQLIREDKTLAVNDAALGRYMIPRSSVSMMRNRNKKPGPKIIGK